MYLVLVKLLEAPWNIVLY